MMKQKTLWFDTETTGLDPEKNDIIQIAALVEINKEIVDKLHLKIQPVNWENISEDALKINGCTFESLNKHTAYPEAYHEIIKFLDRYVDKFNTQDKLLSAGQNVKFDIEFLRQFFFKNGNKYFGSYFDYHFLDLQAMTALMIRNGLLEVENFKLETVAKAVGIELDAHDAMNDIIATREIFLKYEDMIFGRNEDV